MKTLIFVTEFVPGRTGGAAVATLGMLGALRCGGWRVHLIVNSRGTARCGDEVRALCESVTQVRRPRLRVTPIGPALRCFARWGYWPRWQPEVAEAIEGTARAHPVDALFLDHVRTAEYGRLFKEAGHRQPVLLREHNVEHELQRQLVRLLRNPLERLGTRLRGHRYGQIERNLPRYCDVTLPISEVDGRKLAALSPRTAMAVVPSPVESSAIASSAVHAAGAELLFVGGMGYGPNLDAVTWLAREILPRIAARRPDVRLTVVGAAPPAWLDGHDGRVTATGFVDDVRPYFARARALVTPLRFGSGVRIKILDAIAMGKPVVSTTLGAEGILVEDGRSIVLADDAERFAEAVVAVLADDDYAASLGDAALAACRRHYAPEAVAREFEAAVAAA